VRKREEAIQVQGGKLTGERILHSKEKIRLEQRGEEE